MLKFPATPTLHRDARIITTDPLHVVTPETPWAYAISYRLEGDLAESTADSEVVLTKLSVDVVRGRVGIGWTNHAENAFLEERYASPGRTSITLTTPIATPLGRLVLRNADLGSSRSEFILTDLHVKTGRAEPRPYQTSLDRRDFAAESPPLGGGINVFDDAAADAINRARLAWLESLDLPLRNKRVLDAGCGVGHFIRFYRDRGSRVVGIDGRHENIEELRRRMPDVEGHVGDVQRYPLVDLGRFDVIHCFGLLYHLDSPISALRSFADVCDELLLLETMVCDSSRPVAVIADETKAMNQALAGLGSRPSPTFVTLALNRIGFHHVYGTTKPPVHPDFQFEWKDNLDVARDGHNLRAVFVASRRPLNHPLLVSLLDA